MQNKGRTHKGTALCFGVATLELSNRSYPRGFTYMEKIPSNYNKNEIFDEILHSNFNA